MARKENTRTLVLNASYVPLAVVPLRRAVVLVLQEKAEVVEYSGEYVHSERMAFEIPAVIRIKHFVRVPYARRLPVTRMNVLKRDDYNCAYCTRHRATTIDHILPKAQGGLHTWKNVAAACRPCNGKKGNRTPEQANMPLLFKPFEPAGTEALVVVVGYVESTWEPYLAYAETA